MLLLEFVEEDFTTENPTGTVLVLYSIAMINFCLTIVIP